MVKRLRLENFRGVKKGEIELGNMTILVGPNNSAKTTILEALFLMPNPFRSVPYVISSQECAASLIHEMHKTLDSQGYLFLLYKYIAEDATIEWDDGNYLKFVKKNGRIYTTTNNPDFHVFSVEGLPHPSYISFDGVGYFGHFEQSNIGYQTASEKFRNELLASESLLISSELTKPAYRYISNNWPTIINSGITKEVAGDVSHLKNTMRT